MLIVREKLTTSTSGIIPPRSTPSKEDTGEADAAAAETGGGAVVLAAAAMAIDEGVGEVVARGAESG